VIGVGLISSTCETTLQEPSCDTKGQSDLPKSSGIGWQHSCDQSESSEGGRKGDEEEDGSRGNKEMMRSIED
jgi:hypothetical protein